MNRILFILIAMLLLILALFGSDQVAGFLGIPDNALLIQIFVSILSVIVGIAALLKGRKEQVETQGNQLEIKGGVHQSGNGNVMKVGNKIETAQTQRTDPRSEEQ